MAWHKDGSPAERGVYANNERTGKWGSYYPGKSALFSCGTYQNGKFEGFWEVFFENGNLKQNGNFSDGKCTGFWNFFYENGKLKKSGKFIDDKENGIWSFFDETGLPYAYLCYENGKPGGIAALKNLNEMTFTRNLFINLKIQEPN
jgi:antitoxin component YwqK of YwqJK toxin-antitoxin module